MSNEQQAPDKRNASQRLDDLEGAMMQAFQSFQSISRDIGIMKEAIQLLGAKVDAIVSISQIAPAAIEQAMIMAKVADLKSRVDNLLASGTLTAATEVSDNSFIVGEELDKDGKVTNPRIQFGVGALSPEIREKFKGGTVGSNIALEGASLSLLEIYDIVMPAAPAAPTLEVAPEQVPAPEAAPEVAPEATPAPEAQAETTAPATEESAPVQAEGQSQS